MQRRWTCLEFDVRYAVGKFVGGGGRIFGRGVRQKGGGVGRTPERPPPGYGPATENYRPVSLTSVACKILEHCHPPPYYESL